MSGNSAAAIQEYQIALEADPNSSLAAGDLLALLEAGQHQLTDASRLWKTVFDHDPAQLGAGMNLAVVECAMGERAAALATLDRLPEFAPDSRESEGACLGNSRRYVRNAALPEPRRPRGIQPVNRSAARITPRGSECYA